MTPSYGNKLFQIQTVEKTPRIDKEVKEQQKGKGKDAH